MEKKKRKNSRPRRACGVIEIAPRKEREGFDVKRMSKDIPSNFVVFPMYPVR